MQYMANTFWIHVVIIYKYGFVFMYVYTLYNDYVYVYRCMIMIYNDIIFMFTMWLNIFKYLYLFIYIIINFCVWLMFIKYTYTNVYTKCISIYIKNNHLGQLLYIQKVQLDLSMVWWLSCPWVFSQLYWDTRWNTTIKYI